MASSVSSSGTITLGIDTTGRCQFLAIARDGRLMDVLQTGHITSHTETIIPGIDTILTRNGLAMNDLGKIAVVTGPGSFTGTRIGIATAYGLADALGVPAAGMNSLELAASAPGLTDGNLLVEYLTRQGSFLSALFVRSGRTCTGRPEYRTGTGSQLAYYSRTCPDLALVWTGPAAEAAPPPEHPRFTLVAAGQAVEILVRLASSPDAAGREEGAEAFYLHPPDAKPARPLLSNGTDNSAPAIRLR